MTRVVDGIVDNQGTLCISMEMSQGNLLLCNQYVLIKSFKNYRGQ
jgi:hypothetical protein